MIARRFHFDEISFYHLLNALRMVSGDMSRYNADVYRLTDSLLQAFRNAEKELKAQTEEVMRKSETVRRALAARGETHAKSDTGKQDGTETAEKQGSAPSGEAEKTDRLRACAETLAECRDVLRAELAAVVAARTAFEGEIQRARASMTQAAESMRVFCGVFESSFRYATEALELRPQAGTDSGMLARSMQVSPRPRASSADRGVLPAGGSARKQSVKERCLGEMAEGAQTVRIPAHAFREMGGKAFFDGLEGYRVVLSDGSMIGPDGTITLEKI